MAERLDVPLRDRNAKGGDHEVDLLVPLRLRASDDGDAPVLSLFTTLTTFGTPRGITLDELCIELFFPADPATEAALRG